MRVHVLGRISIAGPDGRIDESDLPGSLGRVTMACLLMERGPIARNSLADVLWADVPPAEWGTSLSATLSKLRTLLGRAGIDRSRLATTSGAVELSLPPDAWIDREDAVRRLDRAEGSMRHGEVAAALTDATVASTIFGRPFLPGVDHRWADEVRRDGAARRARSLDVLADGWCRNGDPRLAADAARQLIALDPIAERGYRLAMSAALELGEYGRCRQLYDECRATLWRELGIEPSPDTVALGERFGIG